MADAIAYHIQIYTFGTLRIVRAGEPVAENEWQTRQARQLLKILITERPRPVSTDRLIDLLWPESTAQAAATTLRSAVNALRHVLEPDRPNRAPSQYILTQTPGYAFPGHPAIWLDVDAFAATLAQAEKREQSAKKIEDLQAALALYADDYLTSDPYGDWARHERERLRERYLAALLHVATLQAEQGDYTAAIAAARQVLTRDPVRESAYQALMRYQAESGDSASALLTYERCRALLAEELGADPSPLTQAWHQRILNGAVEPAQPTAALTAGVARPQRSSALAHTQVTLPQQVILPILDGDTGASFVGRSQALAGVTARLKAAIAGHGGLLILDGEAGVGKTRLAYHSLQWAAQAGATVLSATCQPLEQQLPFAPLADALSRYFQGLTTAMLQQLPTASLTQLAQLIPSLQDRLPTSAPPTYPGASYEGLPQGDDHYQRVIDSLIALLGALTKAAPIVIFLDDLQWADRDTLAVLSRLAPRLPQWPLFVLLAYRTDDLAENAELSTLLHSLRRTSQSISVTVSRLTSADVQHYIQQMTDRRAAIPMSVATTLYQVTQGNALFVTEALRAWQERELVATHLPPTAGQSTSDPAGLNLRGNPRVQEIILERIHRLPNVARDLLYLAAVIGRDFSLDLLEQTAHQDPMLGLEILLQRRFLIERPGDRLDFSHQLVRQVAYDNLFVLQRRRFHLRVADALAASPRAGEIPGEIAFHYRQAGPSANQRLAYYTVLAGERLLRTYGFRQAIEAFDEALARLETQPQAESDWVRRALEGRGLAYEALFDPGGVTTSYRQLKAWAQQQGDQHLLLTAYSRLTTMLSLLGQQRESNELLREFLDTLAGSNVARSAVMLDLFERRQQIYAPDRAPVAEQWEAYHPPPPPVADAPTEILQHLLPRHATLPLFVYGWLLRIQGQVNAAIPCLENAVDLAKQTGQPTIASIAYHQLAIAARMKGDLAANHALNDQSLRINQAMQGTAAELTSMWPRISSAFLALQQQQLTEAERRLRRVADFLGDQDLYRSYRNSAQIGLGLVALARGEVATAQELLENALTDPINLYPYIYVQGLLGLATIAKQQGQAQRCRLILQRTLAYAGQRSLLEEYVETLATIVALQPADAPLAPLLAATLAYGETTGLAPLIVRLRALREGG
ncbi:MAG: AAA family ATPase [Caldilineaceae bacterium]|nr:AAA family ATPase [Caldilineaceae bacterium]